MVFYNLFIFLNNEEAVNDIRWLVIKLLEDEQLEVSHISAQLLSFTWLVSSLAQVLWTKPIRYKLVQKVFLA